MGFPTDETDRLWKDLYSCEFPARHPVLLGVAACTCGVG
jgi:hypothetical protein